MFGKHWCKVFLRILLLKNILHVSTTISPARRKFIDLTLLITTKVYKHKKILHVLWTSLITQYAKTRQRWLGPYTAIGLVDSIVSNRIGI